MEGILRYLSPRKVESSVTAPSPAPPSLINHSYRVVLTEILDTSSWHNILKSYQQIYGNFLFKGQKEDISSQQPSELIINTDIQILYDILDQTFKRTSTYDVIPRMRTIVEEG